MSSVSASPISPQSGANDFSGLRRFRERAKLRLRAFLHPYATDAWLEFLNSEALFGDLASTRPRLVGKIYRPYQTNTMSCAQRVRVLIGHYRFIQRIGWGDLALKAAAAPLEVGAITGKSGDRYRLELCAIEPMDREGELVLRLLCHDTLVYSCAFTFVQSEHGMNLGVGCMQGPRGENGLELIRTATRDLHGLRPKNLMIKLLGVIGNEVGCKNMQLVSNRNRVLLRAQRQGKVHADYDDFWRSCGAVLGSDGNYVLSCGPIEELNLDNTASNKRSGARRKHVAISHLATAVSISLNLMSVVPQRLYDASWPLIW